MFARRPLRPFFSSRTHTQATLTAQATFEEGNEDNRCAQQIETLLLVVTLSLRILPVAMRTACARTLGMDTRPASETTIIR